VQTDVDRSMRVVPDGGAAIFRFGDRAYAVQLESTAP
jgi:hypothetical protein